MNAPPGVDSDSSGEDFTPPPSPPRPLPKARLSLSSLLHPAARSRKECNAAHDIKSKTPEQAADDVQRRNKARLKKQVRIAVDSDAVKPSKQLAGTDEEIPKDIRCSQAGEIPSIRQATHRPTQNVIEVPTTLIAQNDISGSSLDQTGVASLTQESDHVGESDTKMKKSSLPASKQRNASSGTSGRGEKDDAKRKAGPSQAESSYLQTRDAPNTIYAEDPSWSECLVAVARAINLLDVVLDSARRDETGVDDDGRHKLITGILGNVMASLIMQRDIIQALESSLGPEHVGTVRTFISQVRIMIAFLKHIAKSPDPAQDDVAKLEDLGHGTITSLVAEGVSSLLARTVDYADFLTPDTLSAVFDLLKDWLSGNLELKNVVTVVGSIEHELRKETRRKAHAGTLSHKEKTVRSWLAHALSLISLLAGIGEKHGAGRANRHDDPSTKRDLASALPGEGAKAAGSPHVQATTGQSCRGRLRNPVAVIQDHLRERKNGKGDRDSKALTAHPVPSRQISHANEHHRGDRVLIEAHCRQSRRQEPEKIEKLTVPSPAVVSPEARDLTRHSKKPPAPVRTTSPSVQPKDAPDSSPSVYSLDDTVSIGTTSSDDLATQLLVKANSGPTKRSSESGEPDNCASPTEEQVSRAKTVVYGGRQSVK